MRKSKIEDFLRDCWVEYVVVCVMAAMLAFAIYANKRVTEKEAAHSYCITWMSGSGEPLRVWTGIKTVKREPGRCWFKGTNQLAYILYGSILVEEEKN